jgi:hypothetical protein
MPSVEEEMMISAGAEMLKRHAAKKAAALLRRKNTPPTKPWSVNMLKEFAAVSSMEVKTVFGGKSFYCGGDAWRMSCQEMVGVLPCATKTWNGHIWMGDKTVAPSTPGCKVMGLFNVSSMKRRESPRYVVSDGKVWADVYRTLDGAPWVYNWRWWASNAKENGGWRLVDREKRVPLTQTAQRVIKVALINFSGGGGHKKLLLDEE